MANFSDIIGKRFGDWKVARVTWTSGPHPTAWLVHAKDKNALGRMSAEGVRDELST